MTLGQLTPFLLAAALVAALPGANNLLSLARGIRAGFWRTVASLTGRFTMFALSIAAAAVGRGALLEASAAAFAVVKWVGVADLAWLGVQL